MGEGSAKEKLSTAKNPWAVCYGPAAAFVASCRRLRWIAKDAMNITTDEGREFDLRLDPPH